MKNFLVAIGLIAIFCGDVAMAEEENSEAPKLTQEEMEELFGTKSYSIMRLTFDEASVPVIDGHAGRFRSSFDSRTQCESELLNRLRHMTKESSYRVLRNSPRGQLVLDRTGKGEVFLLCVSIWSKF